MTAQQEDYSIAPRNSEVGARRDEAKQMRIVCDVTYESAADQHLRERKQSPSPVLRGAGNLCTLQNQTGTAASMKSII